MTTQDLRALPVGRMLSGYRIDAILGQGGFGITYLATDTNLMRQVAIKEYFPREFAVRNSTLTIHPAANKDDKDTFEWGLGRFLKEARLLALFEHPNIIAVRRFFEANGTAYLVMDYCEGKPLDEIIKRHGTLSEDKVKAILTPLLNGLERIHKTGFLHRDIKPANLYIRLDGSPVILDFGSAIKGTNQSSSAVTTMVADGYAPIEQYDGNGEQGPYTDIYGLAVTLYRAVTGEIPQASTGRILNDRMVPASIKARGQYSEQLLSAIDAGLAVRPENRPQTVAQWREIFDKIPAKKLKPITAVPTKLEPSFDDKSPMPFLEIEKIFVDKKIPETDTSKVKDTDYKYKVLFVLFGLVFSAWWFFSNSSTGDLKKIITPTQVESDARINADVQDCAECPVLKLVPGGTYRMGSKLNEVGRQNIEGPDHSIELNGFYVSKFEITVKEWAACVNSGACQARTSQSDSTLNDSLPVTNISWYDAQAYILWLSKKAGKTYQLLSEAQWEYAARAESQLSYSFGNDASTLSSYGWFKGNSDSMVHKVGEKNPNKFGLYDFHGNVAEWTADCWNESYSGAPADGSAWKSGNCSARVIRGGAWDDAPEKLRSASRKLGLMQFSNNSIGFRLSRNLD